MSKSLYTKSRLVIVLLFTVLLAVFFKYDLWHRNRVTLDAPSYYTYLPATFIHHDLSLQFIDKDPTFFKDKIWYYTIEDNKRLIKHPLGLSFCMSPFFLMGHVMAKVSGAPQDGYSMPYQNAVSIGVMLYLLLAFLLLRKLLLRHFSESVTAWTLLILFLGTNLFWYASFEGFMPHAISFSVLCMALYAFLNWIDTARARYLLAFGFFFGLVVLIRPLAITILLYFLVHAVLAKGGFKGLIAFLRPQTKNFLLAMTISLLLGSLQFFYWRYATGHWLFDVYMEEHFVFSSPQFIPFLFSFRKGWFVYTPLMLIIIPGLLYLYRRQRSLFFATVVTLFIAVYLLSSWWAWSYGICWGMRPMIDYYSLLSLPLAGGLVWMTERGRLRSMISSIFILVLILLNLFQTWQYKNGLIHFDDMSREAYFHDFFRTKVDPEWYDLLKPYQWDRRMKGLPQIEYGTELLQSLNEKTPVYFRASNLQFISVNAKAQNVIAAYVGEVGPQELFYLQPLHDHKVCIRASNGLLLSLMPQYDQVLSAKALVPTATEMFELVELDPGDNRFALLAANGNYLSMDAGWPFILKARATTIGKAETFRYFLNDAH